MKFKISLHYFNLIIFPINDKWFILNKVDENSRNILSSRESEYRYVISERILLFF